MTSSVYACTRHICHVIHMSRDASHSDRIMKTYNKKVNMPLQKKNGYRGYISPYTVIMGATNQSTLESDFPGLQCTSMAIATILFWTRMGCTYQFDPSDINRILVEGNELHTKLRKNFRLSTNVDGMIGISDIPHSKLLDVGVMFDLKTAFRLTEDSVPLIISGANKNFFLGNLPDYLINYRPGKPVGFLLTVKCYTYAILRLAYGAYALVDSHGHAKIRGRYVSTRAGVLVCPTLLHLVELIGGMHGRWQQCDIAPVTCEQRKTCQRVESLEEKIPSIEEMDNPYISLMAH